MALRWPLSAVFRHVGALSGARGWEGGSQIYGKTRKTGLAPYRPLRESNFFKTERDPSWRCPVGIECK